MTKTLLALFGLLLMLVSMGSAYAVIDPASSSDIEIDDVTLVVNGNQLEIMASLSNKGDNAVNGIDLKFYIEELGIVETAGVGSVKPNDHAEMLYYIGLDGIEAGEYTVMVEALGSKGRSDVIYRTFEIEDKRSDVQLMFNISKEPVKVGFFEKIWRWFADSFAGIF